MKRRIVIVGSGFSGMWAATSAVRLIEEMESNDIEIKIIAPRAELHVRPRLYEENVAEFNVDLTELYEMLKVEVVKGTCERIDSKEKIVWYKNDDGTVSFMGYDRLILATGSHLNKEQIEGAAEFAFDVDQLYSAKALEAHIHNLANQDATEKRNTFVVCGGGFTGIEVATELPHRVRQIFGKHTAAKVFIIDRGPKIGGHYSEQLRSAIREASENLDIEWVLNSEVKRIDENGIELMDGKKIASSTVIVTTGVRASELTKQIDNERDINGRFIVNDYLQLNDYPEIYATGDTAHAKTDAIGNTALMTCQHAIQLGKFAGNNAAASLLSLEPLVYRQEKYVTCLDLGEWGAVYSEGWDQKVVAIRDEAKKIKKKITNEIIYPPKLDKQLAFASADPLAKFV